MEDLMTVQEAARFLGVSETAIRNARLEGRLPTEERYGRKLIPRVALEEYKQRTQPDGVKPKGRPGRQAAERSGGTPHV